MVSDTNHIDFQTDQYLVRKYVSRILTRFYRFRDNFRWTDFRSDLVVGSPLLGLPEEDRRHWRCLESEDVPALRRLLVKVEEETSRRPCPEGLILRNLRMLARELKLSDTEFELMTFLLALEYYAPVKYLVEVSEYSPAERTLLVAVATGLEPDEVKSLMSDGSTLINSGLVEGRARMPWDYAAALISEALVPALTRLHEEPGDVLSWAVSRDRHPVLPIEAFSHLKPWHEAAWRCLKAADLHGRGLNILLHGPGGVGKTALARCLAQTARLDLFSPPQKGPVPRWRESDLVSALAVLRRRGHGVLLVDPGFLSLGRQPGIGQLDLLCLMDHPRVQVLWTAPSLDEVHPILLRRFNLVLALPEPPEPWTRPVWEDLLTPDDRAHIGLVLPVRPDPSGGDGRLQNSTGSIDGGSGHAK